VNNLQVAKDSHKTGDLTYSELSDAKSCLFKVIQKDAFPEELQCFMQGKSVLKTSSIARLAPFVDENRTHEGEKLSAVVRLII